MHRMLLNELIDKYDLQLLSKGKKLVSYERIQVDSVTPELVTFKAGFYSHMKRTVKFRNTEEFKTSAISCDCTDYLIDKKCEHVAASIIFCLGQGKQQLERFLGETTIEWAPDASSFFKLPVKDWEHALRRALFINTESFANIEVNRILVQGDKQFTVGFEDQEGTVTFKNEEDETLVFVSTDDATNQIYNALVRSTLSFLMDNMEFTEKLFDEKYIKELTQQALEDNKLSEADFKEYYYFGFKGTEPDLFVKDGANLKTDQFLEGLVGKVQQNKKKRANDDLQIGSVLKASFVETDNLEFMMWNKFQTYPSFYEAPLMKNKSSITAAIQKFSKPILQDMYLRNLMIDMLRLLDIDWESREEQDLALFEALKEQVTKLSVQNHFLRHVDETQLYAEAQKRELSPLVMMDKQIRLAFEIVPAEKQMLWAKMNAYLVYDDQKIECNEVELYPFFLIHQSRAFWYESLQTRQLIKEFSGEINFTQKQKPFLVNMVNQLSSIYSFDIDDSLFEVEKKVPAFLEAQVYLSILGENVVFKPRFVYEEINEQSPQHLKKLTKIEEDTVKLFERDDEKEKTTIELLEKYLPNKTSTGAYFSRYDKVADSGWFLAFHELCRQHEIALYGLENFAELNYNPNRPEGSISIQSGLDWFDMDLSLKYGEEEVNIEKIMAAFVNKKNYVELDDGSRGILPDDWLKKLDGILENAQVQSSKIQLPKAHFKLIHDQLIDEVGENEMVKQELQSKVQALNEFSSIEQADIPGSIIAELRNYQKEGYNWLQFLKEFKFGGCLADDMGLGKTLQVITALANHPSDARSLVVLPLSLVYNWISEIEKFCPTLTFRVHHGPQRKASQWGSENLIITTYGTLVNDIDLFEKELFHYIILDESQAIKNPLSKRYKAVIRLKGLHKLALTGTPIENNTFDLYAQMNFVNPGLLGSIKQFQTRYSNKIDVQADEETAEKLRRIVNPFILRRTKEKVASDLPDKTETVIYCEMAPTQRKVYNDFKKVIVSDLEKTISEKGFSKSKIMVLDALLKLRQLCIHPQLLSQNIESIKFEIILERLESVIGNHKVLVFSQFVKVLSIFRKELEDRGIEYCYLDGKTTNRMDEVNSFQNNENKKVFLISMKAGNTGLNLTAADYVFIVDPWWNPAVEAQAIDRTHRIGQDKHVFAYKFICKNSIEEKIIELQNKKKRVSENLIQSETSFIKSLDQQELMSILY